MNRLFVRVLSIFLSILFITGTMWSSAIGVFAEENTEKDIWDGTRNDFIEKDGDTYFIKSAKDFAWFSAQVNAGNTFFGKTVELKINTYCRICEAGGEKGTHRRTYGKAAASG